MQDKFNLRIKKDDKDVPMFAYLTTFTSSKPFTAEEIHLFLSTQKIKFGIMEDSINEIVAKQDAKEVLVAQGQNPKNGENAKFESLCPFPLHDTIIDLELLSGDIKPDDVIIPLVTSGTPILKKLPSTRGVNGKDIFNSDLKAINGIDLPLYKGKNTNFLPNDKTTLVATEEGYPFIDNNTASIEKVLIKRSKVTSAGGNLDFDGIILIYGDIYDGVRITATGDVLVLGAMEGSLIDAGRNVLICGGVTGKDMAAIKTKGNINSKFVEMATLESGADIIVDDLSQSFAFALNKVMAHQIAGGEVRATSMIEADIIGHPTGDTMVAVGTNPYLDDHINQAQETLLEKKAELKKATEALTKLLFDARKDELKDEIEKLRETVSTLELQVQKINIRRTELEKFLANTKDAYIRVNEQMYPGVEIDISGITMTVQDEITSPTVFKAGKYAISSYSVELQGELIK